MSQKTTDKSDVCLPSHSENDFPCGYIERSKDTMIDIAAVRSTSQRLSTTGRVPGLGHGRLPVEGELVQIVSYHLLSLLASLIHAVLSGVSLGNVVRIRAMHVMSSPFVSDAQGAQQAPETARAVRSPRRLNLLQSAQRPAGSPYAQLLRIDTNQFSPGSHLVRGKNPAFGGASEPEPRCLLSRKRSTRRSPSSDSDDATARAARPSNSIDRQLSGSALTPARAYRHARLAAEPVLARPVRFRSISNNVASASFTSKCEMP